MENKSLENTEKSKKGDIMKNIACVLGAPEGKEREKETEAIFEEMMAENFSKLKKDIKP